MEVAGVLQQRVYRCLAQRVYFGLAGQVDVLAANAPLPGQQGGRVLGLGVLGRRSFSRRYHVCIVAVLFGVWRRVWEP